MRIITIQSLAVLALGVTLAGSLPALAQMRDASPQESTYADRDAAWGDLSAVDDPVPEAATTPATGTIQVTFVVDIKSAIPSGSNLYCLAVVGAAGQSNHWVETNITNIAVSASTRCTVAIPYSWLIAPSSEDRIEGRYEIALAKGKGAQLAIFRSSLSSFLLTNKLPADGTISKYEILVTL
jgi:hypothetical protein